MCLDEHLQLALRVFQSCHHVLGQLLNRIRLALLQHVQVVLDALHAGMQPSHAALRSQHNKADHTIPCLQDWICDHTRNIRH